MRTALGESVRGVPARGERFASCMVRSKYRYQEIGGHPHRLDFDYELRDNRRFGIRPSRYSGCARESHRSTQPRLKSS